MIDFYKDNFDSRLLGISAYKLILSTASIADDQIMQIINSFDESSMICCITPFCPSNIELLQRTGFRFISTKNVYKKNLNAPQVTQKYTVEGYKLIKLSMGQLWDKELDFSRMVSTIAPKGRYAKDELIPPEIPILVYSEWIYNSIHNAFADEVVILLSENTVAGMITLKLISGNGSIDLIIVDPLFQGKGIGNILLLEAHKYFLASEVNQILVETEAENIISNIFYQRNRFVLHDFKLVFHKHITK